MEGNLWRIATALVAALLVAAGSDARQKPAGVSAKPRLENTGTPMQVSFECTEEDLRESGLSCTADHPCPVYLELAALEPVGAKIFVVGNIHTASTTLYSVLLASEDSGKTWNEPFSRIPGAVLDRIQFTDFQRGWIGGQIVRNLPRDPFLLLTTDGGSTWRRRPLFEENRIGAIELFRFDSPESGTLWLDRSQSGETEALYERYESQTGGESWMLREVSSRPILKESERSTQPVSGWRLRPQAASDSYRIEKLEGEQWRVVATFLISISECRPPEQVLPEPEQPPGEAPPVPRTSPDERLSKPPSLQGESP